MKNIFLTLIFLLSLNKINFAEPFFCFPKTNFIMPAIALRAAQPGSFTVKFDVKNFEAFNFKISSLDSVEYIKLYEESIIKNIKSLNFLKDTLGAELIIRYLITPVWKISQDYAEAVSDNEIHFVFRGAQVIREIHNVYKYPKEIDTLFIESSISYISGMSSEPSNILVERIFDTDQDSSIIHINNHPGSTSDILRVSKLYNKDDFTRLVPEVKYYFIRFKILREIPECNKKYFY